MDEKFQFTEEQKALIKEKMGVSDISDVRLIFEVDSINTFGVKDGFSKKRAKYSIVMCACQGGGFSWFCCD